jgi:UDP-N-acetylmuramate dehydrogenase
MSLQEALVAAFGGTRVMANVPLAPLTTFKAGGAADWFLETRTGEELITAVRLTAEAQVPITVLGGGSNVLVGDRGVRGLVVRPRAKDIAREDAASVSADAGVTLNGLVRWTITHGLGGLEAWAGTPGTVGGGIYGNAHYAGRMLGDLVRRVRLVSRDGVMSCVPRDQMAFGYDWSRLHATHEIVLSAVFSVEEGRDPVELRRVARESLAHRKRTQPLDVPSAGCIFQNPDPAHEAVPPGIPPSAGALVDRAGLKGVSIGAAQVSPAHANFIVNTGGATAADLRALIECCKQRVAQDYGVTLREEIVYLGEF